MLLASAPPAMTSAAASTTAEAEIERLHATAGPYPK
jgi:hypothetical protein